jgi:hypothetical protein
MRHYKVEFYMVNSRGTKLGDPVVLRFYSGSDLDTECLAFRRMLLDYGRAVGRTGSYVEIISLEK